MLFRLKKKGQATVELLLVMAMLVPILTLAVGTIKQRVFGALESFLSNQLKAQARYGYSYEELKVDSSWNDGALTSAAISGTPPILYYTGSGGVTKHPLAKVDEGWKH